MTSKFNLKKDFPKIIIKASKKKDDLSDFDLNKINLWIYIHNSKNNFWCSLGECIDIANFLIESDWDSFEKIYQKADDLYHHKDSVVKDTLNSCLKDINICE